VSLAAVNVLDARSLLSAFGIAGIFVVLFAETGLLIGFFLPGDSLLFTAGLLSSPAVTTPLPLPWVLVASVGGALLGAQVGYLIGRRAGPALHDRARRPKVVAAMDRSRHLLDRYGQGRAIVLARFIPVVRTVLNPVAGALGVPARTFTLWQIVGGLLWSVGLVVAGFVLGGAVPGIDQYLLPVIGLIIVVSLLPLAAEVIRARRRTALASDAPTQVLGPDQLPTERLLAAGPARARGRPRILLVDPDPTRRARLSSLLGEAHDIQLVGTASGAAIAEALLDALGAGKPDVVLVASDAPVASSASTITVLARRPNIQVLAYTADPAQADVEALLAVGAKGVLAEQTLLDDFRSEVHGR
jgi:membrane-associated protein